MIVDSSYRFDLTAGDPDAFEKGTEVVERGKMHFERTRSRAMVDTGNNRVYYAVSDLHAGVVLEPDGAVADPEPEPAG